MGKHEDPITRFGALLGQGIIDAGGRNVCASFFAKSGAVRQGAAVGFLLFCQMWYWFPLVHGLSLSFNPTAIIGLNKGLKMPKNFSFKSDVRDVKGVKQSSFDYPAAEETKKSEEVVKAKAVLSTAAKKGKVKAGVAAVPIKKDDAKKEDADSKKIPSNDDAKVKELAKRFEDVEMEDADDAKKKDGDKDEKDKDEKDKDEKDGKDKEKKKKQLPALMTLQNPSRVVPGQEKYIKFDFETTATTTKSAETTGKADDDKKEETKPVRYVPLLGNDRQSGFLLLEDKNPGEPEEFVEASKVDPEPSPPEAFEWIDGVD